MDSLNVWTVDVWREAEAACAGYVKVRAERKSVWRKSAPANHAGTCEGGR